MRRLIASLLLALSATPLAAQDRPLVVTVNAALARFAEALAGDAAQVLMPVPDGTDPAFWKPRIADISMIQSADLIVLNGAGYAAWTTRASLPRSRLVDTTRGLEDRFIATESVTHSHGADGEHTHEGTAAFTWLDPELASRQAAAIARALVAKGIVAEDVAEQRLAELDAALADLDAQAARLAELGRDTAIIATHPRYQYLARAYGLTIHALQWDPGAAPDAAQLAELEALVAETGAEVLIWEAAPPDEARDAVRALGLVDCVFPTLAAPGDADYFAGFAAGVADLARALDALPGR